MLVSGTNSIFHWFTQPNTHRHARYAYWGIRWRSLITCGLKASRPTNVLLCSTSAACTSAAVSPIGGLTETSIQDTVVEAAAAAGGGGALRQDGSGTAMS